MSNKPIPYHNGGAPTLPSGYVLHDASDPRCEKHELAKKFKGIKPNQERVCPACVPAQSAYTDTTAKPKRKRRKATRPAA